MKVAKTKAQGNVQTGIENTRRKNRNSFYGAAIGAFFGASVGKNGLIWGARESVVDSMESLMGTTERDIPTK